MELGYGELAGTHESGTWGSSWDTWSWGMGSYLGHMDVGHVELAGTYGALTWGARWVTWSWDIGS